MEFDNLFQQFIAQNQQIQGGGNFSNFGFSGFGSNAIYPTFGLRNSMDSTRLGQAMSQHHAQIFQDSNRFANSRDTRVDALFGLLSKTFSGNDTERESEMLATLRGTPFVSELAGMLVNSPIASNIFGGSLPQLNSAVQLSLTRGAVLGSAMNFGISSNSLMAGNDIFDALVKRYSPGESGGIFDANSFKSDEVGDLLALTGARGGFSGIQISTKKITEFVEKSTRTLKDIKDIFGGRPIQELMQIAEDVTGLNMVERNVDTIRTRIATLRAAALANNIDENTLLSNTAMATNTLRQMGLSGSTAGVLAARASLQYANIITPLQAATNRAGNIFSLGHVESGEIQAAALSNAVGMLRDDSSFEIAAALSLARLNEGPTEEITDLTSARQYLRQNNTTASATARLFGGSEDLLNSLNIEDAEKLAELNSSNLRDQAVDALTRQARSMGYSLEQTTAIRNIISNSSSSEMLQKLNEEGLGGFAVYLSGRSGIRAALYGNDADLAELNDQDRLFKTYTADFINGASVDTNSGMFANYLKGLLGDSTYKAEAERILGGGNFKRIHFGQVDDIMNLSSEQVSQIFNELGGLSEEQLSETVDRFMRGDASTRRRLFSQYEFIRSEDGINVIRAQDSRKLQEAASVAVERNRLQEELKPLVVDFNAGVKKATTHEEFIAQLRTNVTATLNGDNINESLIKLAQDTAAYSRLQSLASLGPEITNLAISKFQKIANDDNENTKARDAARSAISTLKGNQQMNGTLNINIPQIEQLFEVIFQLITENDQP